MTDLSIGLPSYRGGKIAWLALEGLCRQLDAPPWELLVLEEPEDGIGQDQIAAYEERLTAANCQQIKYAQLDEWVPLAVKWVRLAETAEGEGFVMHSDDQFSNPRRLTETADAFHRGADAVTQQYQWFYSFHQEKVFQYNWASQTGVHPLGANKAFRTSLIRQLPIEHRVRSVDSWTYIRLTQAADQPLSVEWIGDQWTKGLNTNGVNRLSWHREKLFQKETPPYSLSDRTVEEILPPKLAHRLLDMDAEDNLIPKEQ